MPFQLFVEVDEGAAEPGGHFAAEHRLAGAHEAGQGDVTT